MSNMVLQCWWWSTTIDTLRWFRVMVKSGFVFTIALWRFNVGFGSCIVVICCRISNHWSTALCLDFTAAIGGSSLVWMQMFISTSAFMFIFILVLNYLQQQCSCGRRHYHYNYHFHCHSHRHHWSPSFWSSFCSYHHHHRRHGYVFWTASF